MGFLHGHPPAWSHHDDMLLCLGARGSFIPCDKHSLNLAKNSLSRHCLSSLGFSQALITREASVLLAVCCIQTCPTSLVPPRLSALTKLPPPSPLLLMFLRPGKVYFPSQLQLINYFWFQGLSHLGPGVIPSNCRLSQLT